MYNKNTGNLFMYHTEGIVLAYYNSGEADRFLVVYTKDFGLLRIFAKSIRLAKSKLTRHTQLFSHARLSFVYGRDFLRLTDAEIITPFSSDDEKLLTAGKISRFVTRLVSGEEQDDVLWQILNSAFGFLRQGEQVSEDFDLLFGVRVLHCLGYVGVLPEGLKKAVLGNEWADGATAHDNLKYSLLPIFNSGLRISQL